MSTTTAHFPDAEYLPRRTVSERRARGASLRDVVPVEKHAAWAPTSTRIDPIAVLEQQAQTRTPELVPLRYGRMAVSPFAFFRGGAAIMAADLAGTPTSGLQAQLCGDAHLLNFGFFVTPERSLIFDLNDFDETLRGPFEWDVKRLAASVEIAARDLGLKKGDRTRAVRATGRAYRRAMDEFATQRNIDVWHARLPASDLRDRLRADADSSSGREASRRIAQAMRRDHLRAVSRLVEQSEAGSRFRSRPPSVTAIEELLDEEQRPRYVEVIQAFLRQYRESLPPDQRTLIESYRYDHIARKVVGVGSVGTRAWVVLMTGRDHDDPLVLQLKEAQPSVLAPYVSGSTHDSEGQRVVQGQRLMQAASDHLLGWYRLEAWDRRWHDFYVRQLWDGKGSIDVANLTARGLRTYASSCAWTLARAHARSGERIAIAAYLGDDSTFDDAIADFAAAYADTNALDHEQLLAAIGDGRITASTN